MSSFNESVLSERERQRYGRHLVMPEVSLEGQQRLKNARVLCVGAGGLGSPVTLYLAAAGVGTLGLVDDDLVDLSNIQRQVLFDSKDVGQAKTAAARARLLALNPDIEVQAHAQRLTAANVTALLADYDLVVDGSDNFPTRYLISDACVWAGKPHVYGSVYRFEGQVSVFHAGQGPCYRCLFPEPPLPGTVPSCAQAGVLGVLPGIIGSLQGLEALKLLLGKGESLLGRLLLFDGLSMEFRTLKVEPRPDCPVCGVAPSIHEPIDYAAFCGEQIIADTVPAVSVQALRAELLSGQPPTVIDVREPAEWTVARFPGAMEIPLGQLSKRLSELDRETHWVLTCQQGPRAQRALTLMQAEGFVSLRVLEGGLEAWLASDPR